MVEEDGRVEGLVLIFSCENSKITTHSWTTIDRRMLDSHLKKILHVQGQTKEKPQQDGMRGKITFRTKLHTYQRYLEGLNKSCVH